MAMLRETFRLGALTVHALSDGVGPREPATWFDGVAPEVWAAALGLDSPAGTVPVNFGSFLVTGDGHTTLIDSGYGPPALTMGLEGGGELLERIAEVGVRREEIDRVVHTHLHGDHVGWNTDAEGVPMFPNATMYVHRTDLEYFSGAEALAGRFGDAIRRCVLPLVAAGRFETFEGEAALSSVLTAIPTPGHTPGHCSMLLSSQGEQLLVLGDAAHVPIHLEHHDWIPAVDLDPAESARSRAKVAALAADRGALVTGGHFPIPVRGHIRRVEGGYRFEVI
jgi:glyoxylase-like metal-dependent hydrolase (beta-lactamase superfamily II)